MVDVFQQMILSKLLDKYENSKVSKGGTKNTRVIKLNFNEKEFKQYVDENSADYEDCIEKAVNILEKKGLIKVCWLDDRVEYIILCIDKLNEVYILANRKNRNNEIEEIKNYLKQFDQNDFSSLYAKEIIVKVDSYKSVSSYFNDFEDLKILMNVLVNIQYNSSPISLRNFSAKYAGNSKYIQLNYDRIAKIVSKFSYFDYLEENKHDYLENFDIYRNPIYVYLKGKGCIYINNEKIDLLQLNNPIAISYDSIENLKIDYKTINKVVTIENFTTFHEYLSTNELVVYTGGFANSAIKEFLMKTYNEGIEYYHFGDIDAGGLYILKNLREKTGLVINTLNMNTQILTKYRDNLLALTNNDRKRLIALLESNVMVEEQDLIEFMLEYNCKMEQENIV